MLWAQKHIKLNNEVINECGFRSQVYFRTCILKSEKVYFIVERMSELCGFVYNKGRQKSRETTREIGRSEGEFLFYQLFTPNSRL